MPDSPSVSAARQAPADRVAPGSAKTLGRFELRRVLGQGAQSVVWLAFDPRLEREVAIKLMKPDRGSSAGTIAQWLQEARSVSRLTHASIVPVFEADVHNQQPYLVFEYVQGHTLSEMLKKRGALPPTEAVTLMIDVLEALMVAHGAGIVHRDLKPSNVLVDSSGKARVMDFGIAARVHKPGVPGAPVPSGGTPGYMSPEVASGAAPAPSMDIFSAGIVLAEMLTGKPLVAERDPYRAIYRVLHEQLKLPADLDREVDDVLRGIVMRALARELGRRHPTAQVFRDELKKWLAPRIHVAPLSADAAGQVPSAGAGTLDFLLRRMRHKSDFPAMSDAVVRIQGIVSSDKESVGSLTNEILKDVALTNKLLRLVNSAQYAHGGSISTVSRAVNLVGFNGIRNMALSLVLLEHMQDKAHAGLLREEFLRSLMAGSIAAEMCPSARDSEEAFIGSMFQNLGRLLTEFYFPDEAASIRAMVTAQRQPLSEVQAATSVLGLSFEELGLGVSRAWGLPEGIQRCMRRPSGEPPLRPAAEPGERMRWLAQAANDMADTMLSSDPAQVGARLDGVAKRYSKALGIGVDSMQGAIAVARHKLIELAGAMELKVRPGSDAARLLLLPDAESATAAQAPATGPDTLVPHELHATVPALGEPGVAVAAPEPVRQVSEVLAAGIADITNAMVEDFKLSDILRMILETMFRAMAFRRIVFCMRDARTDTLTGRFGLGVGVEKEVSGFRVALRSSPPDLFAAVCLKGADTMISDATEARIAQRLPAWFRDGVNAHTFLLLPLQIKGAPFGLIYADKEQAGGLALDEKELSLLRTLRNQAVMAFRQAG